MIEVILAGYLELSTAVQKTVNHPDFETLIGKEMFTSLGTRWEHQIFYQRTHHFSRTLSWKYPGETKFYLNSRHKRSLCSEVGSVCAMRGYYVNLKQRRNDYKGPIYQLAESCTKVCKKIK